MASNVQVNGMQESTQFSRGRLILWGGILVVLLVVSLIPLMLPHFHSEEYDSPRSVEFILNRTDGSEFQLSDLRGRVVVVYFGYTSCPDVCPTTLHDLHRITEELGEPSQDLTVVFVTVDPETDTPEKMSEYLGYFDPTFIGLTGTPDALQNAYQQFGIDLLPDEETVQGYGITHTTSAFVVDRAGRLRLRMHYGARPQDMADDITRLLKEKSS